MDDLVSLGLILGTTTIGVPAMCYVASLANRYLYIALTGRSGGVPITRFFRLNALYLQYAVNLLVAAMMLVGLGSAYLWLGSQINSPSLRPVAWFFSYSCLVGGLAILVMAAWGVIVGRAYVMRDTDTGTS